MKMQEEEMEREEQRPDVPSWKVLTSGGNVFYAHFWKQITCLEYKMETQCLHHYMVFGGTVSLLLYLLGKVTITYFSTTYTLPFF